MAAHARVLDRRRFQVLMGEADGCGVVAAVDGYRNPDGGYGWGLEPDLRSPESQPGAALHAFEAIADAACQSPATSAHAVALCDWLESISLPDGGLPFALPLTVLGGTSSVWTGADHTTSSLQITAVTTAHAHRVAAHDPAVAAHPWLARATRYCLSAIAAIDATPEAYVLSFAVQLLDTVYETEPQAPGLLDQLGEHVPADGIVRVQGGLQDEMLHPLDLAPYPDSPARRLLAAEAISADLERLASDQRDDGGWTVDFASGSPAGALEWRGYATVSAIDILGRNA